MWAPEALLEAPVTAQWWTLGAMALMALTLVVTLALWLGRIIARSVHEAARAAIALGEGVPMPVSRTPIAEADTLMAELREAAVKRQTTEGLLRENEATFRAMFDISSVGKFEVEGGVSCAPTRSITMGQNRPRCSVVDGSCP